MQAKRSFKVPWGNRFDFATGMLSGGGVFGTEARYYGSSFTNVRVQRARIRPIAPNAGNYTMTDPESQLPTHTWAKVTLDYATQTFEVIREEREDGTWVTYDGECKPEFMTLPGRALKWESDNEEAPPDVESSIVIPLQRHRFTWHNVAAPEWTMLGNLRGKVNAYGWTIPALGIDALDETMLFEGYTTNTMSNGSGTPLWQLTFDFLERQITQLGGLTYGWNHTYRAKSGAWAGGWDRLTDKDTGEPQYATGDFDQLYVQQP
jgi:hypothetical protein